jgi:hypothetical protein
LRELIRIVKIFITDGLFYKSEELEVTWAQVRTMGWLRESNHLQAPNFGDAISCCVNSGIIHVDPH